MAISFIEIHYSEYAIGSACRTNESGDMHEESFFVWTRLKEPSIYMRRKMRNILIDKIGVTPENMVKGHNVKCWAEDYFPRSTNPIQ